MKQIRVTREEVVELLKEKYGEEYAILNIFPHMTGYVIDVEEDKEDE